MLRRSLLAALPVAAALVASTVSSAAPTAGTAKPSPTTSGPALTAKPLVPRIVSVRPAPSVHVSGRLPYEVEIDNPLPRITPVTIVQGFPGGAWEHTAPANARTFFVISMPQMPVCQEHQTWQIWNEATPDEKRTVEHEPNCKFKTTVAPTITAAAQPTSAVVVARAAYQSPQLKAGPAACGQPLVVEADVVNRTAQTVSLGLDLGGYRGQSFPLAPGATKSTVFAGTRVYSGQLGRLALNLVDRNNEASAVVTPGTFAVEIVAECTPSFRLRPGGL